MAAETFDLIVIGSGPGGYVCAIRAAQLGMKVACVEKEQRLGGTCLNVGCIPSKALLESSHYYEKARQEFKEHGILVSEVKLDLAQMQKRRESVVSGITSGVEFLFKKNKITRLSGVASFQSANEISVGGSVYQAKNFVIATGSTPIDLPQIRFDHEMIVDSTDALTFPKVPKRLLIIGAGVIGVELGSVWNRLGSEVIVLEALPQILGTMDESLSRAAQRIFTKQGLTFHLETKIESAKRVGKEVKIEAQSPTGKVEFSADKLLIAIGRKANTEGLNAAKAGVTLDARGRVEVDASFRTKVSHIYAIGDVIQGPMLAHKAEEEGVAVAEIIAKHHGHVNYETVAGIVYTSPEIASVGLTEAQCKEKGLSYKSGQFFFKANGRAKAMGESEGFVKLLADSKTDRLLGAHILGPNASELIAEVVMAMEFGASAEDVARTVHAHPTLVEAIKEAALDVDRRAIHS